MGLEGKKAVVTGGGAGIGAAIAERLRERGADVVTIDADASTGASVAADLGVDAPGLAQRVLETYGPFDLIVNNVGVTPDSSFLQLDENEWDRVFAVNLRGPWFFTKGLVQALLEVERPGSVLFVSSLHDSFICGAPFHRQGAGAGSRLPENSTGPHRTSRRRSSGRRVAIG